MFSCSSHTFFPSESYNPLPEKEKKCDLKYLQEFPEDKYCYEFLGSCRGKGRKGMIKTEYDNAQKMVDRCACEMGADAIIMVRGEAIKRKEAVGSQLPGSYTPGGGLNPPVMNPGGFLNIGTTYKQTGMEVYAYVLSLHENCTY